MAADSFEEGKPHVAGLLAGTGNAHLDLACFQLHEPISEKAKLGKDISSISISPNKISIMPRSAQQPSFLSFLRVFFPPMSQISLDARLNCQNGIDLHLQSVDAYESCVVDVNLETSNSDTLMSPHEAIASTKTKNVKVLQRQSSLIVDKAAERFQDAPASTWRRYKRAASFGSRKIAFLFSIVSSVGTLVLIYLTLRAKQTTQEPDGN